MMATYRTLLCSTQHGLKSPRVTSFVHSWENGKTELSGIEDVAIMFMVMEGYG